MRWEDITTIVIIIATFVIWIAWDVYLGARGIKTESMWLAEWSRRWSIIPFFLGALVAHWCNQSSTPNYELWPWLVVSLSVVLFYDVSKFWWEPPVFMKYPGLWLIVGIPTGSLFFPQRFVP